MYLYELIKEFSSFLRNQPQEKFIYIAFVQVKTGATGDEKPWKGTPKNNQYNINTQDWENFRLEVFDKFKEYFNNVSQNKIPLTFNNIDPIDEP